MARNVNLLIVDDDISILETVGDVFQEKGYNVAMVDNGQKAIKLVSRRYFDVVLMDIKMPGIDGLETYKEVKRIIPTAAVIMMTADSKEELVKKAIEEGAYTIIYKPFNVKRVIKIVEEALKKPIILIVDDRIEDRETLRDILAGKGYRTVLAKDGYEAVGFSEKGNFDLILLDIKVIDSNKHKEFTGVPNERILENAIWISKYMKENGKQMWIRTPIIPKYTAFEENIRGIGKFIVNELDNIPDRWDLLSFNNLCTAKYERLDLDWILKEEPLMAKEQMEHLYEIAKETGVKNVQWSGLTKKHEYEDEQIEKTNETKLPSC